MFVGQMKTCKLFDLLSPKKRGVSCSQLQLGLCFLNAGFVWPIADKWSLKVDFAKYSQNVFYHNFFTFTSRLRRLYYQCSEYARLQFWWKCQFCRFSRPFCNRTSRRSCRSCFIRKVLWPVLELKLEYELLLRFPPTCQYRGHGGRVITLSPPTSEIGVRVPSPTSSGEAGSCLSLVVSLQYRTLTNCMYRFPLPFQLPVVIWPVQCWKRCKTPNKQINQCINIMKRQCILTW